MPIPQIILAEKKDARGKYIVIDGKQRLLTIRRFFATGDDFKPLKLSGLEILTNLNGKTYEILKDNPIYSDELTQIENQSIRTVVIKNWQDESFLYTVFLRLNTGSKQLSPQELRQALHPGEFIDFADEFSVNSEQIKEMLNLSTPDYRMRDVEIVIRYFALKYFILDYDGNLKKSFDNTVKILNKSWDTNKNEIINAANELNNAIAFTINLFGNRRIAFSKWNGDEFQGNFNRAIYDVMVYYFSNAEIRSKASGKEKEIIESFKSLCENDKDFLVSFEHTTKSMENIAKRLTTWGDNLKVILGYDILVPKLNQNNKFELI